MAITRFEDIQQQAQAPATSRLNKMTIFDLSSEHLERLKIMAKMYAASSITGKSQLGEGDFFLIMLKGLELGISPMAAVDTINIIAGKPVLDAKGMLALVKSSGLLENIHIDSTTERCIVTVKRVGNVEQDVSFSMDDARTFKTYENNGWKPLAEKANWKSQPATMLKWRAVTSAMREVFPDVIAGLYTPEELDPDNTYVNSDGSMELGTVPQLPEPSPSQSQDINDVDSIIGTTPPAVSEEQHFMMNLIEIIKPMCKHENHARNAIEKAIDEGAIAKGDSLDKAAGIMLLRRMKSQWGLTEDESRSILPEALGMTMKDYLAANPRDYSGIWAILTERYSEIPD